MSKTPDQKVALVIATLAAFFIPFMGSSVNIALPTIGEEFGMDAVSLSWVATSFLLAAAMFLLPFGRLADIHGRKRFFAWGIAIYTLASLLSAVAPSGLALILFRGLQGLGGAMIFSTGIAILTSVYPQEERGKVLGFSVGSVYLGLSFGPSIGGFLTEQFGWRSVFMVHVPIGLLIVSLIAAKLKGEWADARGERFDWVGSLIYTSSLMGVVYGLSLLPQALGGWLALSGAAGTDSVCGMGAQGRQPPDEHQAFPDQHRLCLLQPGGPDPLQRHLCRGFPAEPLPAIHSGLRGPKRRPHPDRPTGGDGRLLPLCRQALGPHRAQESGLHRDGPDGPGTVSAGADRQPGPASG